MLVRCPHSPLRTLVAILPCPHCPWPQVCLVLNKGKPSRDHTYPSIRAALLSLLHAWRSPFTLADVPQGCRIPATACDITGALSWR